MSQKKQLGFKVCADGLGKKTLGSKAAWMIMGDKTV